MSHVTKLEIDIVDLSALKKACADLGLDFREGQQTWRWFGSWLNDYSAENAAFKHGIKPEDYGKSTHAIAVKGDPEAYEIGVVQQGEKFALVFDFWGSEGRKMAKLVGGPQCHKLLQAYSVHAAKSKMQALAAKGFNLVSEVKNAAGQIHLCYRKN